MFKFTKSVCFALLVWLVYRHYDNSTHENVMPFYTPFPTKINEYQNLEIWKELQPVCDSFKVALSYS